MSLNNSWQYRDCLMMVKSTSIKLPNFFQRKTSLEKCLKCFSLYYFCFRHVLPPRTDSSSCSPSCFTSSLPCSQRFPYTYAHQSAVHVCSVRPAVLLCIALYSMYVDEIFLNLKGLCHQIRITWKWYCCKGLGMDMKRLIFKSF
jgi:hypothetical protein